MAQEQHFLQVRLGPDPLPFFAEYSYFVWGEVDYESEGDCRQPTDRQWSWLTLVRRDTGERIEITCLSPGGERVVCEIKSGSSSALWAAAYLTAIRSSGSIISPPSMRPIPPSEIAPSISGVQYRMVAADRVHAMFTNPSLAPFDSHAWWGGWKWSGEHASQTASGLRYTLRAVEEGTASTEMFEWLQGWWNAPPNPDHTDGVRYALYALTGSDPAAW